MEVLDRLVMMVRGLADPLASLYCRLYMVHRMQKFGFCNSGNLMLFFFQQNARYTNSGKIIMVCNLQNKLGFLKSKWIQNFTLVTLF